MAKPFGGGSHMGRQVIHFGPVSRIYPKKILRERVLLRITGRIRRIISEELEGKIREK